MTVKPVSVARARHPVRRFSFNPSEVNDSDELVPSTTPCLGRGSVHHPVATVRRASREGDTKLKNIARTVAETSDSPGRKPNT